MQLLARMLSRASSAEDDLAYLTKTMPLAAIRSILQYSRSLNFDISAWADSTLPSSQLQACTASVTTYAADVLLEQHYASCTVWNMWM